MFNIIYTEMIKLKRSKLMLLFILGVLIVALMQLGSITYQERLYHHKVAWDWLIFVNFEYTSLLAAPILFPLFMGSIVAREFNERTINQMLVYPFIRAKFLVGKYVVMIPIILAILALIFICALISGFLMDHDPLTEDMLWRYIQGFLWLSLMSYSFVPLAALVSMVWRSIIPTVVLGVLAIIIAELLVGTPYSSIFPWSAPITMLIPLVNADVLPNAFRAFNNINYTQGAISLSLTFFIPLIFNFFYYTKMDVNN
jgi:ABC-type transport system involved in multi-copper enzyme maturation permease subunit